MVVWTPVDPGPFFVQSREQSNTAFNFIEYLIAAVNAGFITRGDILICDNARVHTAFDIQDLVLRIVQEWGVQLKFLPTYSPEFNPCELVFALVKGHLRSKIGAATFLQEIVHGFTYLTTDILRNFYRHCRDYLFVHGWCALKY